MKQYEHQAEKQQEAIRDFMGGLLFDEHQEWKRHWTDEHTFVSSLPTAAGIYACIIKESGTRIVAATNDGPLTLIEWSATDSDVQALTAEVERRAVPFIAHPASRHIELQ